MKKIKLLLLIIIHGALFQMTSMAQDVKSKTEISFETFETKLKQASPKAQILDARTPEEFKLNHLNDAINVAINNEAELQNQINKLDKSKPVFVYSINNGRSGSLAKKLREQNFTEVYELPGGISKWIGEGKPVVTTTGNGLTRAEYEKLIQSNKLVLVDVHSKFCGSCKRLVPVVDSVASDNSEILGLVKVELFDNKQLGKDLNIQSIPTLLLYKGDKLVWRKSGLTSSAEINQIIKAQL